MASSIRELLSAENVSRGTGSMHGVPRFGFTNNFSSLFSDDDLRNYLTGISIIFGAVVSFLLLWGLCILFLKCLGRSRVGPLSGSAMRWPGSAELERLEKEVKAFAEDTDEDILSAEEVFENLVQDVEKRVIIVRIITLLLGSLVIAACVLLVLYGFIPINNALAEFSSESENIFDSFQEASQATKTFNYVSETSSQQLETIAASSDNWCPAAINQNIAGVSFGEPLGFLQNAINNVGGETFLIMKNFDNEIKNSASFARGMKNASSDYAWVFSVLVLIATLTGTFALYLNISIAMAWGEHFSYAMKRAERFFVLPFFCFVTLLCIALTFFTATGGIIIADFCADTENSAFTAMQLKSPLLSETIGSYFNGCRNAHFLENFAMSLEALGGALSDFSAPFQSLHKSFISDECGPDAAAFFKTVDRLYVNTGILYDSTAVTAEVFSCRNIHFAYKGINESVCTSAISGSTWAFSMLLLISACALMMITLRTSWQIVRVEDDEDDDVVWEQKQVQKKRSVRFSDHTIEKQISRSMSEDLFLSHSMSPTEFGNENIEVTYGDGEVQNTRNRSSWDEVTQNTDMTNVIMTTTLAGQMDDNGFFAVPENEHSCGKVKWSASVDLQAPDTDSQLGSALELDSYESNLS